MVNISYNIMSTNIYIYTINIYIYVNCMNIWLHMLHPHDFPIKMMMPLALEAQGVLSQWRGRVFHDGASLTDSGKSRPKSQLQWDYHGITKTEDPQILDLKRILYPSNGIYILCVSASQLIPVGQTGTSEAVGIISPKAQVTRPAKASFPTEPGLSKVLEYHEWIRHFPMD